MRLSRGAVLTHPMEINGRQPGSKKLYTGNRPLYLSLAAFEIVSVRLGRRRSAKAGSVALDHVLLAKPNSQVEPRLSSA